MMFQIYINHVSKRLNMAKPSTSNRSFLSNASKAPLGGRPRQLAGDPTHGPPRVCLIERDRFDGLFFRKMS